MEEKPVRVLYFVDRMLRGGIQSLVIDWVSRFDKSKIHVDFLLLDDGKDYELEQTLKDLGCTVYKLNGIWVRTPIDFIKYKYAVKNFFKEHHDYKVVHMHSSSKNYMVLKYAKKYDIPIRIAHSHCTDFQTTNYLKKIIGDIFKKPLIKYSTDYFACSKLAGEWLFGKKIVETNKFRVIHNAVDYDKFKYNQDIRNKMRNELGINNSDILIGHVGRFVPQKNHAMLIDIFNECYKKNNQYKLLMVGTGELETAIKEKVKRMGLEKNTIFVGFRTNVNEYMQAMDLFALPSLLEGLGLVLVEAQAGGLPCIATANTIPDEVKINPNFYFVNLNVNEWVQTIQNIKLARVNSKKLVKAAGYFIEDIITELTNEYQR